MPDPLPVADRHVHTEWSWDAAHGDMMETCARAVQLGLPTVAFTEHADFNAWVSYPPAGGGTRAAGYRKDPGVTGVPASSSRWAWSPVQIPGHAWPVRMPASDNRSGYLDIAGYWEAIDRCRAAYPDLRIESGAELGEPNLFPDQVARLLAHRPLDRILGSMHCIEVEGELVDMSVPEMLSPEHAGDRFRRYLNATRELAESSAPFAILAHLDYPKRYWPHDTLRFDERDYEEEYRAVLVALARSGRALEVNSSRGMAPPRGPCPGPLPIRWWHEAGGAAISFGSDAHRPEDLAAGLGEAVAIAAAAGFHAGDDPVGLWLRD